MEEFRRHVGSRLVLRDLRLLNPGLPPIAAAICVALTLVTGEPVVGPLLLLFGAVLCSLVVGIVIHELAHLVFASVFGLRPWCIQIGHGRILLHKQWGGLQVLRQFPYSGMVHCGVPLEQFRWRSIAMIAAGPLANLILAALILSLVVYYKINDANLISDAWEFFLWGAFVANMYIFVYSVGIENRGRGIPDGDLIRLLLKGTPPTMTVTGKSDSGSTQEISRPGSNWPNQHMEPEILLMALRHQITQPIGSIEERCLMLDQFATTVLMHNTPAFLPEADRYSEELLRLQPSDWSARGTPGVSWLKK